MPDLDHNNRFFNDNLKIVKKFGQPTVKEELQTPVSSALKKIE